MVRLASLWAEEEPEQKHGLLSRVFEEEPVSLKTFIQDQKYMGQDWMLSDVQANAVRHIERIYLPELYPLMAEEFGGYWAEPVRMSNLISLQWGKGSGKDHVCRVASLRVAYLLLCLKSPQKYYEMPEDDSIHLLNIAANSGQANRAFFTPMTKQVRRGWFADKAEPKRDTITYAKNVEAVSGHSDAEGQEGLNIMLGVADEIDAFRAKDEMVGQGKRAREASTSAESILKMLKGSASTRFPESYKRVAISYPRYQGSTIQLQSMEAEADIAEVGEDISIYFNSGPLATWDVNPRVKGKESFASDYRKNPEEAAAMYECKPSKSADPYFRTPDIFREAVYREDQPLTIDYSLRRVRSQITGNTTDNWEPQWTFSEDFQPIAGARYAMHADLAIRGDRAGISMAHVEKWTQKFAEGYDDEGLPVAYTLDVPTVKVDFVTAFEADPTVRPQREIQIQWARMLCFELIRRGFYITRFTFDNFQSADSMQALQRQGIESERVSADLTDEVWKNLRDLASDGRLRIPKNEILQGELEGLTRVRGKVDHPHGGSKDMADALACAVTGAIQTGGEEDADGNSVDVGANVFTVGEALAPLFGQDEVNWMDVPGLPAGLTRGLELYGY